MNPILHRPTNTQINTRKIFNLERKKNPLHENEKNSLHSPFLLNFKINLLLDEAKAFLL